MDAKLEWETDAEKVIAWEEAACEELPALVNYYRQRVGLSVPKFPGLEIDLDTYMSLLTGKDDWLTKMVYEDGEAVKEFTVSFLVRKPGKLVVSLSMESEVPGHHMISFLKAQPHTENKSHFLKGLTELSDRVSLMRTQWLRNSLAAPERALINGLAYYRVPLEHRNLDVVAVA